MGISDGERVAAKPVTRHEVALEVHAPELVRRRHHLERLGIRSRAPLLALRVSQAARLKIWPIVLVAGHGTVEFIRSRRAFSFRAPQDGNRFRRARISFSI